MRKFNNILLIIVLVIPLILLFIYAFTYNIEWPNINITNLRFDALNYWLDYNYGSTLAYSIILSLSVALISILITYPAARVLAYYNFKSKNLFRIIFLLPFIVPITAISIGVYYQFIVLGLAGNSLGVILIHLLTCAPYTVIILERSLRKHPLKKELIARQLGASKLKTFVLVGIPANINAIITSFALAYTISFSQYFTTFIIGQGRIKTYAMEMYPYIQGNNRHYGAFFNLVFIISIIVVLVFIIISIKSLFKNKLKYRIGEDN